MLKRVFGGGKRAEREATDERMRQIRAEQLREAQQFRESDRRAAQGTENMLQFAEAYSAVQVREDVYGPDAKPWQERRTTAPDWYPAQTWTYWHFVDPELSDELLLPDECVGTVFPGDWVIVNDEYRLVEEISTDSDEPVAFLAADRRPLD